MNTNVWKLKKDFHESRIENEVKLLKGEITFEEYAGIMLSFEAELRSMGVHL